MTTTGTDKRQITGDFPDFGSASIDFELTSTVAINTGNAEVFPQKRYTMTLDANGNDDGAFYLPTPDANNSSAWGWFIELPDGERVFVAISYGDGTALSLAEILAAVAASTTPSDLTGLYVLKAGDTMTGALDFNGNEAQNLIDRQKIATDTITGATYTLDPQTASLFIIEIQLTTTLTISTTGAADGDSFVLRLTQDSTGSRTVTWVNVNWNDNTFPTLQTSANDYNYLTFVYNGSESFWDGFTGGAFNSLL